MIQKMKRKNKRRLTLHARDAAAGTAFMLPWLVGLLVFTAVPILYSVWLSLCKLDFTSNGIKSTFVGTKWYAQAFTTDANFLPNILDTLRFIVLSTPMILVTAVILALLLNQSLHGRAFFRALFFFPVVVISGPVMGKLIGNQATAIIKPTQYAVYQIIATLPGVVSVPLLYIFDNVVLILWYSGVQILIILAGLQKIGQPLYEAASIDGASKWQIFWKITLPYLRPMILIGAVYTIMDLACFPNDAITQLINNNMTNIASPYSYSAALSWLYTLAVLAVLALADVILRERRKRA